MTDTVVLRSSTGGKSRTWTDILVGYFVLPLSLLAAVALTIKEFGFSSTGIVCSSNTGHGAARCTTQTYYSYGGTTTVVLLVFSVVIAVLSGIYWDRRRRRFLD
jgi:hypothetical protein